MRLVVLDGSCLNPGDLSWDALRNVVSLEVHDRTAAALVPERAAGAQLLMTNKTPLPRDVLSALPDLRYIGVLATGYNIVDVAAARHLGITVTNIPTYGTNSVAQFAFALLLELCHRVGMHSEAVRAGEWSASADWSFWKSPLVELHGKTMGIVGYGRIGRQTGSIAEAMGMRVISFDQGQPQTDLDSLLRESDVVSLHCPLTADTQGLINTARLRIMKSSAFLLNTSRGPLVNDHDLAEALNSGIIAGAGLDVLSVEPPAHGNPLFTAKNCIVTPHIAWATREARERLLAIAVENVRAFLDGHPTNIV